MGGRLYMIRFCDKEVYSIYCGEMTRSEMIIFFLDNHMDSIIALYNEDGRYYGMVTYQSALYNADDEDYIIRDYFVISDSFWDDVRVYYDTHEIILLPVFDSELNMCSFVWDDRDVDLRLIMQPLMAFEKLDEIPVKISDFNTECKMVFISDCNEAAYRLYNICKKVDFPVSVFGEKWEMFGIKQLQNFYDYPEYEKMYIYAEGTETFRKSCDYKGFYPQVNQYFTGLNEWGYANERYLYKREIDKLVEKGVSVAKVITPMMNYNSNFTQLEIMGMHLGVMPGMRDVNKFSAKQKKILNEIIGNQEFRILMDGAICDDRYVKKYFTFNEIKSEYSNGEVYKNKIFVIGKCIVKGTYVLYDDTLCNCIQRNLEKDEQYSVIKVWFPTWRFDLIANEIEKLPIRRGDIVIFVDRSDFLSINTPGCEKIDLTDIYNDQSRETWLLDGDSRHVNKTGLKVIAKTIYDRFLKSEIKRLNSEISDHSYIQKGEVLSEELQKKVFDYADSVKMDIHNDGKIGSIVMNCNPFTLGHQYLIEYAAKQVKYLYVFVVEENRSYFSFEERLELVRKGTAHLDNVHVVPSGEWVLSFFTLPTYFQKEKLQEVKVDAQMDLEIFARYVAPALGITKRFVGEEPTDKVTKQYNEQMRQILSEFNIEFEEVPRTQVEGQVVSASIVRKYLEEGEFDELKKFVPMSTYETLIKRRL